MIVHYLNFVLALVVLAFDVIVYEHMAALFTFVRTVSATAPGPAGERLNPIFWPTFARLVLRLVLYVLAALALTVLLYHRWGYARCE